MSGAPLRLRCEYLDNPTGIDVIRPRLSWWVGDDRPAEIQTAYHILAASSLERLDASHGDLWDSGKVETSRTYNIEYRGRALSSAQRVWWQVRTFDSDGLPSPWGSPAYFEMGLLHPSDWRAQWIGADLSGSRSTGVQVPLLRRSFHLYGEIAAARLYVAALGVCHVELNGQPVNGDELGPGWTDYRRRVTYRSYNVTPHVRLGENVIGALLADGWFSGHPGLGPRQQYGDKPWLCLQLKLSLASGEEMVIASDAQWTWRPSWILRSDPVTGESVDARQQRPGWSEPADDPAETPGLPVLINDEFQPPGSAALSPPVRVSTRLQPLGTPELRLDPLGQHRLLYDFGQNTVGRISVMLNARRGMELRVRYAEVLDKSGQLGGPVSEDLYTARGDQNGERFEPRFALHGFQFVELLGEGLTPDQILELTALAVHADVTPAGSFSCDHPLLNQLQANVDWTLRASSQFAPCAGFAADKRLGYTGDAQVVVRSATLHHDVVNLYRAWLRALVDAQADDGSVPAVVPTPPGVASAARDGGAGWSDALVVCAWTLYRSYGDRRLLETRYGAVLAFINGLEQRFPDHVRGAAGNPLAQSQDGTAPDLTATALYFYSVKLALRIAGVLGKLHDLERFDALAQAVRASFRSRFVTHDGRLVSDSATAYVLALHLGLLAGAERRVALDTLIRQVETSRFTLRTDPVAAPYLFQVLADGGRVDLAYQLLLQTGATGWLHPVLQGATTLWDEATGARSRTALAAVGEWLFTGLAGLDLDSDLSDANNAYRRVCIRPRPPLGVGFAGGPPIRQVDAALDTVNGRYETGWQITEDAFELRVLVPCNCSAVVIMPDDTVHEAAAGWHTFAMPFAEAGDGIPILLEVS